MSINDDFSNKIAEQDSLYHYTKTNGVQGIMHDRSFFATNANFLNDTNELFYTLKIYQEVVSELEDPAWGEELKREYLRLKSALQETNYYIISFSTDPDSITLWSEFGDKTGYNLEFNSRDLLECLGKHRKVVYHGAMIYSPSEQKNLIYDLLTIKIPEELGTSFEDLMESGVTDRYLRKLKKMLSVYACFFKQQEFSAEQEYRVVFQSQSEEEISYREKDGCLIPYIPIPIGNGTGCIRKITVAPKNHIDLAGSGMKSYAKHLGYDAEVVLSKIHLRY